MLKAFKSLTPQILQQKRPKSKRLDLREAQLITSHSQILIAKIMLFKVVNWQKKAPTFYLGPNRWQRRRELASRR